MEVAAPQTRADHGYGVSAEAVSSLLVGEETAEHGLDPHHFEEVGGDQRSPSQPGLLRIPQGERALPPNRQAREAFQAIAVIAVVQPGDGRAAVGRTPRD